MTDLFFGWAVSAEPAARKPNAVVQCQAHPRCGCHIMEHWVALFSDADAWSPARPTQVKQFDNGY